MNNTNCNCSNIIRPLQTGENKQGKKKTAQRFTGYIKMVIPAFVFVIIPKCPVCLAGYIAVASGIGISITTATYIRFGLIIFCVVSLSYFIFKHMIRWMVTNE